MLLKSCAYQLAKPLSLIYQASFDEGQLPSDWKLANISPIFKKGPKNNPGNYRPVSLTSVLCKIMKGILRDHLLGHLDTNHITSVKQHGFVWGRSCLTYLLETLEEWTSALEKKERRPKLLRKFKREATRLVIGLRKLYRSEYIVESN